MGRMPGFIQPVAQTLVYRVKWGIHQAPIPAVQPICSLKMLRAIYGVIYAEFNIAPVIIFHSVFPALFLKPLHEK